MAIFSTKQITSAISDYSLLIQLFFLSVVGYLIFYGDLSSAVFWICFSILVVLTYMKLKGYKADQKLRKELIFKFYMKTRPKILRELISPGFSIWSNNHVERINSYLSEVPRDANLRKLLDKDISDREVLVKEQLLEYLQKAGGAKDQAGLPETLTPQIARNILKVLKDNTRKLNWAEQALITIICQDYLGFSEEDYYSAHL